MTTTDQYSDRRTIGITGGVPLTGRITVQGSKNIALHLYAAALLSDTPLVLHHAPDILDTGVCADILTHTGTHTVVHDGDFTVIPAPTLRPVVHHDLGARVRTTAVLAAAVLARTGQVDFPVPGGDAFCPRLIDRHLAAMEAAGAVVTVDDHGRTIHAACPTGGLRPFRVDVATPYGPSLGATVTALLLAARAPGTSLITSPSIEPEVTETIRFLAERGVRIAFGDGGLRVQGTDRMTGGAFTVAGDRIEAATMIMAAAATGGTLELDGITLPELPDDQRRVLARAGILLTAHDGGIRAVLGPHGLQAVSARTGPHPGLPTDTAPQLAALLTLAEGTSDLFEAVYPRRDTHVEPLRAFGADITATGQHTRIRGVTRLRAADVQAADIRAVTALVIAALAAKGTSTIGGMYHLARGYGRLLPNLAALGADITTDAEARP
ncbi:UDP-N-acetylglucosamine 1-carboxyvinyltransferase [Streptomyces sp. KCTC 0041BP]|uniref:UDP-N-acetylglucosamine 1-carboxyvinyltransferase n=1 Tax=Streptomyces sp. KCTC 0041BP TaxID=201500 RepID=UPI001AE4C1BD|nr:UDP-N-acetylglucosamine 1-carboxyvinyltransferase [Streptomyces sp. KCTC 0041BP]MBP0932523.1 UDP-N-acetylglucosamine 1-carboxyvinyltransferase [Streptomyces sp. KCTC 0041BP]